MPLVLRKKDEKVKDEVIVLPEIKFVVPHPDRKNVETVVVEEPPRNRTVRVRHQFQAGPFTEYYIQKPWSYFLFRGTDEGTTLLTGIFFAEEELTSLDQEGVCAAPLPNVDYGIDHGIGVCLWAEGKKFGSNPKVAAVKCHNYFWISNFNTGVRYYDSGRPEEIQTSSWLSSMEKWQDLTLKGKKIDWKPIKSCDEKKLVKTLSEAIAWLTREKDFNYR